MPIEKLFFIDVDGVLTKGKDPKINERAVQAVARLANKGYRVAFITGRSGPWIEGDIGGREEALMPALKKFGIEKKVLVFCEDGFYLWHKKKPLYDPTAQPHLNSFFRAREILSKEIEKDLKKNKVRTKDATCESQGKFIQNRFEFANGEKKEDLVNSINGTVQRLKKDGVLDQKISYIEVTRNGVNVFPQILSKANAARQALKYWGLKRNFTGRAYGDRIRDYKMALGTKIKFIRIEDPEQFIKELKFIELKIQARKIKGSWARIKRTFPQKIRKKAKQFLGIKRIPH
ncbi:MAG: HAD hydrolase family protein [Candidatus Diapherotrites archaeon]